MILSRGIWTTGFHIDKAVAGVRSGDIVSNHGYVT